VQRDHLIRDRLLLGSPDDVVDHTVALHRVTAAST